MHPLVIAHHLIWTVYGQWLPNDPRGSMSRRIADDRVAALGEAHYGRKAKQPASREIRAFYTGATEVLKHPVLTIRGDAMQIVASAFGEVISQRRYTCDACAIMPDHIHILIRKHRDTAEEMIEALQSAARGALIGCGRWPEDHPVWTGGGGWPVFLDHPDDVERTIAYIERNPVKAGMAAQRWGFVVPYDRWPLHEWHSPQSPYAKRLRALGQYP